MNLRATPLHERVADVLRDEIRQRQPGERLAPDPQQAERLSVSVVTIRDAMRLLVEEGLVERRRGAGTFVSPQNTVTGRVALLCIDDILSPSGRFYWIPALRHLQRRMVAAGFSPDIHMEIDGFLNDGLVLRPSRQAPLKGVVILHTALDMEKGMHLEDLDVPVVSAVPDVSPYWVKNDDQAVVRLATEEALDSGSRRPALLLLDPRNGRRRMHPMQEVFAATLAGHGQDIDERCVLSVADPSAPGVVAAAFRELWQQPKATRPDAVVIADDSLYTEFAIAVVSLGLRVPDDLLVLTHGNVGSGIYCPFPTVQYNFDPQAVADALVDKLLTLQRGDKPKPAFTIFAPQRTLVNGAGQ